MPMELLLGNRKVKVKTSLIVGQGGEAVIYRLDSDTVLKLFKGPDHPDFAGLPQEQEAAQPIGVVDDGVRARAYVLVRIHP